MTPVLLTRPVAASERLETRLKLLGYRCVIAPMLKIVPLETPQPDLANVSAVIATSAHAFESASLPETLRDIPCYCVGAATSDRARAAGFRQTRFAENDGAALADLMIQSNAIQPGTAVLHLAGRNVHEIIWEKLALQGIIIKSWIVYEAQAAQTISAPALAALRESPTGAALFFSARTAAIFATLSTTYDLASFCAKTTAICISKAALVPFASLRWKKVCWADMPTEDSVVSRLREVAPCA